MVALSSQTGEPTLFFRSFWSEAHRVFRGAGSNSETTADESHGTMDDGAETSLAGFSLIVSQTQSYCSSEILKCFTANRARRLPCI